MINKYINRISFKIGLLFSSIFLILLLLLGYISYGLFSQTFIDYISQDLLVRGDNHAQVLTDNFSPTTVNHVALMEKNVVTEVVVTDGDKKIIAHSDPINEGITEFINNTDMIRESKILNKNWTDYWYIATISPIDKGNSGYVYMFYPTDVLNEIVFVIKGLVFLSSIGVILIAVGLIVILSRKMTKPLLRMKEATNKMASGYYKQKLRVKGKDELAQLAESIQSLGEQLQHYEETRNEFLAGVSHELRTPLTYIKGYTDILAKGIITDEEEMKKYLNIINQETKRVTHLVNDLFELSKIQTGQFILNMELTEISSVLEKVINNLTPFVDKKGLKVIYHKEQKSSYAMADPYRLEQVFFNLIENAIKYTDEGEVRIKVSKEGEYIKIIIEDTGIGIARKELPKIWDRFYRVEKSRARKTGGSGLGLFLVKEIIQLHEGKIEINSKEGKGTIVTIRLKNLNRD